MLDLEPWPPSLEDKGGYHYISHAVMLSNLFLFAPEIFVVEIQVLSFNFTSDLKNKSSPMFLTVSLTITNAVSLFIWNSDSTLFVVCDFSIEDGASA